MVGEDAHLEAQYEDRVVDLSYEDNYDPDLNEEIENGECDYCEGDPTECDCTDDDEGDEEVVHY